MQKKKSIWGKKKAGHKASAKKPTTSYVKKENRLVRLTNTLISSKNLVTPRYFTKMKLALQGVLPNSAPATGYCQIYANTLFEPFNSANSLTSSFNMTLTDASAVVDAYNGYTLLASMYNGFRIHSSKLNIKCTTGVGGDTLNMWSFAVPNSILQPINTQLYNQASGLPYFKTKMITAGAGAVHLNNYCKTRNVLGMTKAQYDSSSAVLITSNPAGEYGVNWYVYYATLDGATIGVSSQVYIDLEIECFIEFCNPKMIIG